LLPELLKNGKTKKPGALASLRASWCCHE